MAPLGEPEVVRAYRAYFPVLRAKCGRMLDDAEAQDVAQETFTRLWRARLDLHDTRAVLRWLYTTSTRLAVDRLRAGRRVDLVEADEAGRGDDPERVADARALLRRVAVALAADELEALVLWRVDGLDQVEIAELLGASERTVRRRLRAAEEALERLGGTRG